MFENATLLVTGGTGSFGNDFIRLILDRHDPAEIIVFSRDEKKQHDMRLALDDPRVSFVIGDVRDRNHVMMAMRGVDYVFHAAALKQVPSCEFFPMEAVQTNILGTNNLLDAAEFHHVRKLVVLSTDKAVYPINAMGLTKALMEKLTLARAKAPRTAVTLCGVRYGNVMYSRGSVIPLFVQQIKAGLPITLTNPSMTRLLLPLAEAVKLVTFAMEHGHQGDFFVRKAPTATVEDLCTAVMNLFDADNEVRVIGTRDGEKVHEVLVTAEEIARAEEFDEYYRIPCHLQRDYVRYFSEGDIARRYNTEGYTSENAERLSVRQIEQLLLSLPEIQAELQGYARPMRQTRRAA
jgi:UDP-N-acetylglucosamine 4,6-dehydratase/5-epimerase